MSTLAEHPSAGVHPDPPADPQRPQETDRVRPAVNFVRRHALDLFGVAAIGYLLAPVLVVVVFSFNDPAGRFNYTWQKFTLDNWKNPFGVPGLAESMLTSLEVAAIAAVAGCVIGTPLAMALARFRFRGRAATDTLVLLPMATPEVVMGASLLALFLNLGIPSGFGTIALAHTMFVLSFVVVTVRARLVNLDRHLEEAAADLGAGPVTTFRLVTFPLILPSIVSAALLAFLLSIDDFVITNFNSGTTLTFPLYVWGAARVGVPPQVNVIGTMLLLASLAVAAIVLTRRKSD
jgi:spermidine/putrescine transport system permease protein